MSGGITQLVAVGAQDAHLVGKPQVSFFRSSYKRHTNFSHTVEQQVFQGNVSNNGMSTIRFERKGDMLSYVYFTTDDGTQSIQEPDWTKLIKKVELLIGGQVVDTQDSQFSEKIAIDAFAGNMSRSSIGPHGGAGTKTLFYPLRFFFCDAFQSALPLVALQYHDVEIRITWGDEAANTPPADPELYNGPRQWKCFAHFIYLDTEERRIIADSQHDMLIYQVQKMPGSNDKMMELTFNHPVKFIAATNKSPISTLTKVDNRIKFQFNGVDVGDFRYASPNFVDVPSYFHTSSVSSPDVFFYSFALNTERLQPSGTLNFSRLDSARIISENQNITDDIYAVNYNILRIKNGMAGVMYAN